MVGNKNILDAILRGMKCMKNNQQGINEAAKVLTNGGIVAHPADTCYGLAGNLMSSAAMEKLQLIKGRDAKKPMSIMLPVYLKPRLSDFVQLDDFSEMVCEKLLPGPVTIVLPKGPKIPDYFFPNMKTIGVRIPYGPEINDFLAKFQGFIITTSANLSDQPICSSCKDVVGAFEGKTHRPDLYLDGEVQGSGKPSTVIALENSQVRILREGPMEREQLEAILGINI